MRYGFFFHFALWLSCYQTFAQVPKDTLTLRIATYNVENLFDCKHDSLKNDYEFLPEATRHWNYFKYKKKLDNLARTIIALGGWNPPAIVALCEVENDTVMHDLTRYSALKEAGYRYLMTRSQDERGIDVALLYQRSLFKPLFHRSIPVTPPQRKFRPTRDILHVSGLLPDMDTLDVFVAHFPSRSAGTKVTEPYRMAVAHTLKTAVDTVVNERHTQRIIILGDFNDYPSDKSVRKVLEAEAPPLEAASIHPKKLYHLLARRSNAKKKFLNYTSFGSYKYRGEWGLLDHIIISGLLLQPSASFHTDERKADVFTAPFLLTDDLKYGGRQPFRTYQGMKYLGGYSDHLPVYADFLLIY